MSTSAQLVGSDLRSGVVTSFDDAVGLGEVRGDDGFTYPFHCVEIADGTRTIEVDAPVVFLVLAKLGRHEAAAINADLGGRSTGA